VVGGCCFRDTNLPIAGYRGSAPVRVTSSTGSDPQPAVLLVPGCSGFVANNGINVYDERAAELWARREVSEDILDAVKQVAGQNGVDPV
jgi:hypothetical protein